MNAQLFFKRLMDPLVRIGTPLSVLLMALTLSQSINGQALSGSIVGYVKDNSDAVIPGATVRITHKGTNQTREIAASPDGSFNFPTLETGSYEITVKKPGFKAYTLNSVEVRLNSITRSEIVLDVGGVSETVWVTARNPTEDHVRGSEVLNKGLVSAAQQGGGDSAFQFFTQEVSFDNRLVKGAPFSADIISETIQNLPDGNRIVQRFEGRINRDSQGRTRNERTYLMGGTSDQKQTITIFDPVGATNYSLDPETRIARKANSNFRVEPFLSPPTPRVVSASPPAYAEVPKKITVSGGVLQGGAIKKVQPSYPPIAKAARASGAVQVQILVSETGEVIEAAVIAGHPLLRDAALQAARQWAFKPTELSGVAVKVQGILTFNFSLNDEAPTSLASVRNIPKYNTNTEQLAKQMVEGVECEGARSITTMPAGAIGNERPIETVNETWFSQELKIMIMSKRSDPRFGETTYRVTNISRAEPDTTLFQIPSEYTIIDNEGKRIEMDVKEVEEMRKKLEDVRKKAEETRKPNNQ